MDIQPINNNKAVYFGAGTDVIPYVTFPDIKLWIAADSQPNSEYGDFGLDIYPASTFYKTNFINILDKNMSEVNFMLVKIDGNIREYSNNETKQIVRYHTNTSFPSSFVNNNSPIFLETKNWSIIYVSGYMPYSMVLETANQNNLRFIGHDQTCYKTDEEDIEDNKLNYQLDTNSLVSSRFSKFDCLNHQIESFNNWKDFLTYTFR